MLRRCRIEVYEVSQSSPPNSLQAVSQLSSMHVGYTNLSRLMAMRHEQVAVKVISASFACNKKGKV